VRALLAFVRLFLGRVPCAAQLQLVGDDRISDHYGLLVAFN
jgi:hypothetical protein